MAAFSYVVASSTRSAVLGVTEINISCAPHGLHNMRVRVLQQDTSASLFYANLSVMFKHGANWFAQVANV